MKSSSALLKIRTWFNKNAQASTKTPHSRRAEIAVLAIFFLLSLRVVNWFQYPYIIIGGDFRPPLNQQAFNKRVIYAWDEIDFGMPSVYQARILTPSYLFVTVFQNLGINLYSSQLATVFLMYLIASILMYIYVKQLTNGDTIAAFTAAVFLTSNIYLINDREATAIPVIDTMLMILPSIVTFTEGIMKKSYTLLTLSGIMFVLTYGAFPNYRPTLLGFITLMLTLLFLYVKNGLNVRYEKNGIPRLTISLDTRLIYAYLKYFMAFGVALFLVSGWIITTVSANFNYLLATLQNIATPLEVLEHIQLYDVLRLIAKWGFYSGALGRPYVPYANIYLHNPLVMVVSYLPPILAFAAVLTSKSRKLTIYFSAVALLSLILAAAPIPMLYAALTSYLPFMATLRESAQWLFFTILSYSILIGIVSSTLYHRFRKKAWQITTLSLIVIILVSSSYPLVTGDVTRNWLDTNIKGSYLPNSYAELNGMLSDQHWTLLLPQRGTYTVYNFSGPPFNAGNPYPLIFSKPVISGLGTEYVQSENLDLLNKVYELMLTNEYENVAPQGKASASSVENEYHSPICAIDGDYGTRWASARDMSQWIEIEWNKTQELSKIKIIFEYAYANDYTIETWNGSNWVTQIKVENNTNLQPEYTFSQLTPTRRLRINFTRASSFSMVSIWELEVYVRTEGVSKFLGMLGIKYLILEKDITFGNAYAISELKINQSENFILTKEWNEVALYSNTYALQKLYTASNVLNYTTLNDVYRIIARSEWETLQHSVFINSTSTNAITNELILPENFTWTELSPTSYIAHLETKGPFALVLLESYDEHWKAYVNGSPVSETNHYKVNAFANGWLINDTGDLTISIRYETQNIFIISAVASIVLPLLLLAFFGRKSAYWTNAIRKAQKIKKRIRRKPIKVMRDFK